MSVELTKKLKAAIERNSQAQPAVANNTGSVVSDVSSTSCKTEGHAVAQTPADEQTSASAGRDELPRLSMDQDAQLWIGDETDPAMLGYTARQVEAIYDFLHATRKLWRP